jgi:tetratricopeptide (TPR) repeat protein
MSAWAVAALAVAPRKDFVERRLRPAGALALGLGAVVAMCAFQFFLLRVTQASAERSAAQATAAEALRSRLPATRSRLLADARRHFEQALAYGPLGAEPRLAYGDLIVHLAPPPRMTERELDKAVALYRRAAALNPPSPAAHLRLAGLFERLAVAGRGGLLTPYIDAYLADEAVPPKHPLHLPAAREYAEAVERDPNRPQFRADLAVALGRLGSLDESRAEARRALELHERVIAKHPQHVMRLTEDDLTRVRAILGMQPEERP